MFDFETTFIQIERFCGAIFVVVFDKYIRCVSQLTPMSAIAQNTG